MTRDEAHAVIMSFPEVVLGTSYGKPSYLAFGKFLTRLRVEDNSFVLLEVGFDEREMLMEVDPQTFHFTAHYKDYPSVLARVAGLEKEQLRGFIERRWRKLAPKRWLKAHEAAKA
jgi:hypothetical protein